MHFAGCIVGPMLRNDVGSESFANRPKVIANRWPNIFSLTSHRYVNVMSSIYYQAMLSASVDPTYISVIAIFNCKLLVLWYCLMLFILITLHRYIDSFNGRPPLHG